MIGKTISHYKIIEKLGSGGMGVVYKAEDTKLDRFVALKFLPQNLSEAEEEKQRFIHEAKAASALDHNNICNIHEIDETADGQLFIAMALYEGKTLDKKIEDGPMKLDEAVDIAVQVSEGLAKAHAKEIVHRDLKPANIMLTEEGVVKILDFGLAKLRGRTKLTKSGTTLGTAAYMSPEQARGEEVDQRTDIFSLGVLLYEMLTEQQPFLGDYEQAVLYAILHEGPEPITALRSGVPMELELTVSKCLEKAPEERYQSATDLLVDMKKLRRSLVKSQAGSAAVVATAESATREGPGISLLAGAALGGLAVILAIIAYFNLSSKNTVPGLGNPRQITTAQLLESHPTWSPAGDRLAYHSNQKGNFDIWVSQVGGGPAVNLTEDHLGRDITPSWSPDGNQIAFSSTRNGGGVFIMPALGGIPVRVTSGTYPQWSQDGTKLASIIDDTIEIFVEIVTLENSSSQRIPLPGNQRSRFDLSWSPNERAVAYGDGFRATVAGEAQLWVLTLPDGEGMPVTDRLSNARSPSWSTDGRFLYYVSTHSGTGDLWRQRMSADYRPEGSPEPLTTGIGMTDAVFSPDGTKLAYSQSRRVSNMWRFPIPGSHEPPATWAEAQQLTSYSASTSHADVSPDGQRLLFSSDRGGNFDTWIMSLPDGGLQQLTTDPALEFHGRWSPNGKEVVFHSSRSGNRDIWRMPANGGRAQQLTRHEASDMRPVWSPDGQEIAFQSNRSGNFDIWVIPSMGGEARQVTFHPAEDQFPQWAPDGKWLVFASWRGPGAQLWRVHADGGQPERLTEHHSRAPLWLGSGERIYFLRNMEGTRTVWELSLKASSERQVLDVRGRPGQLGPDAFGSDGEQLFLSWVEDIGDIWVMDVERE